MHISKMDQSLDSQKLLMQMEDMQINFNQRIDEMKTLIRSSSNRNSSSDGNSRHVPTPPLVSTKPNGFPSNANSSSPYQNGSYNPKMGLNGDHAIPQSQMTNGGDFPRANFGSSNIAAPKSGMVHPPISMPQSRQMPYSNLVPPMPQIPTSMPKAPSPQMPISMPKAPSPQMPMSVPRPMPSAVNHGYLPPKAPSPLAVPASLSTSAGLSFKPVEYGKPTDVVLSYAYSARSFFVQLNYDEVTNFYTKLNEFYGNWGDRLDINSIKNAITAKQLVCAFNDDEKTYYRAQVIRETEGKFLVRFVDFGDIKLLQGSDVHRLHSNFAQQPILGFHCYLRDAWTSDNLKCDAAIMDFINLPIFNVTRAIFESSSSGYKFPISLLVQDGGSWKNVFHCNSFESQSTEAINKHVFDFKDFANSNSNELNYSNSKEAFHKLASQFDVTLSSNTSYWGVLTHLWDNSNFILTQNAATNFTTNISFFYRGFLEAAYKQMPKETLVVFGIKNKFFFRGLVLRPGPVDSQVFSIDFGFIAFTPNVEIFPLYDEFSLDKFPVQSTVCGLYGVAPTLGDTWSPVSNKTLVSFFMGELNYTPKGPVSNGVQLVDVEMKNKSRPADMLKKFKLAKDAVY